VTGLLIALVALVLILMGIGVYVYMSTAGAQAVVQAGAPGVGGGTDANGHTIYGTYDAPYDPNQTGNVVASVLSLGAVNETYGEGSYLTGMPTTKTSGFAPGDAAIPLSDPNSPNPPNPNFPNEVFVVSIATLNADNTAKLAASQANAQTNINDVGGWSKVGQAGSAWAAQQGPAVQAAWNAWVGPYVAKNQFSDATDPTSGFPLANPAPLSLVTIFQGTTGYQNALATDQAVAASATATQETTSANGTVSSFGGSFTPVSWKAATPTAAPASAFVARNVGASSVAAGAARGLLR
jgi:hypothetical protein